VLLILSCAQEPGNPRLVSMLLYLNSSWPMENGAETIFLDGPSDTGVAVRPKPGRVVLMDQDIMHRVSAPSRAAGRPRYSLVWKLALLPAGGGGSATPVPSLFLRQDGGAAVPFGSAAKMKAAQERLQ
jgi:2OG-Fe(II) oxygenase superfamily